MAGWQLPPHLEIRCFVFATLSPLTPMTCFTDLFADSLSTKPRGYWARLASLRWSENRQFCGSGVVAAELNKLVCKQPSGYFAADPLWALVWLRVLPEFPPTHILLLSPWRF